MNNEMLREQLLSQQSYNPGLKADYERRVREMFQKELKPWQRAMWKGYVWLGAVLCIGFGVLAGNAIARNLPWQASATFAVGSIFGIGWSLLALRVVKRNKLDLKSDSKAQAAWAWSLVLTVFVLCSMLAPTVPGNKGVLMLISCVAYLIIGLGFMLASHIEQNSLKTREQILRLELRLAELTEELTGKAG